MGDCACTVVGLVENKKQKNKITHLVQPIFCILNFICWAIRSKADRAVGKVEESGIYETGELYTTCILSLGHLLCAPRMWRAKAVAVQRRPKARC